MTLPIISPDKAADLVKDGATLVDIRSAGEYSHRHIPGSSNQTVDEMSTSSLPTDGVVIFLCQSGMRTRTNVNKLLQPLKPVKSAIS